MTTVVHVTTVHPPRDVRIYHKECRTLADAGYDVVLVAPGACFDDDDPVTAVRLPVRAGRSERFLLGTRDAARALSALSGAVYHLHDPELLPLGLWLRLRGKEVIYDAHESFGKDLGSKPYLPRLVARVAGPLGSAVEGFVARRCSRVVCATPTIAAQFDRPGVVVLHNYPKLDEWPAEAPLLDEYLGRAATGCYVGVINDERCQDTMTRGAALTRERVPDAVLTLAGPTEPGAEPPFGDGVAHVGVLDRSQVALLLRRVRFGVVLMEPLPNILDALPTKTFEYMACGLPVIVSSSLRAVADIVVAERCGLVIDHDRPGALADAVVALLDDPSAAWEMGQRGWAAVHDRYSWEQEAGHLLELYRGLVGPPDVIGRSGTGTSA